MKLSNSSKITGLTERLTQLEHSSHSLPYFWVAGRGAKNDPSPWPLQITCVPVPLSQPWE